MVLILKGRCCECCAKFWGSVPYWTLAAITLTILGVIGHVASAIHATVSISRVYPFEHVNNLFVPVISGLSGVTLLPILLAFILAMLSTGYSRDILYCYHITKCCGAAFTIMTMALTFIFFLIWTIYGFMTSGIVVIYVELILSCDKLEDTAGPLGLNDPHLCLPLATGLNGTGFTSEDICGGSGLQEFCDETASAGLAFLVSIGFVAMVIIGLVCILMLQAVNCTQSREADYCQVADANGMQVKYSNHAYTTSL